MALLWIDGFDHYGGDNFTTLPSGIYEGNFRVVDGTYGRAYQIGNHSAIGSAGQFMCVHRFDSPRSSGTIGVGAHVSGLIDGNRGYLGFCSSTARNVRYAVRPNSDGSLSITQGTGGTVLGTSDAGLVLENTSVHIEMQVRFHSSLGEIELRLNGATVLLLTGLDTTAVPIAGVGLCSVYSSNSVGHFIDNLYVYDDSEGAVVDWLGERNVYTLLPNSDESPQDWALSSGSDAFEMLNNVPPTSDYIEASEVDDTSRFGLADLPSSDIGIVGVALFGYGSRSGTSVANVSVGPAGHPGAVKELLQDSPLYFTEILETNPATNLPWEPGEINSLEIDIIREA